MMLKHDGQRAASMATVSVAPPNLSCHPERSEGSLCPASQTLPLRCAQGDNRRHAAWRRRVRPFAALRVTML